MKKILILILILILIFPANSVQAKFPDDLPGPKVMPDSPFYFLKIWYEKIVLFFTFDTVKKAEKYKTFAEKRAYEAQEMIKKGREDLVDKLKEAYKLNLNKALQRLEKAVKKATEKKKEELKQELEQKAEQIKDKIREAIKLW